MPEAGHVKEHMASLLNLGYDSTLYISYPQPLSLSLRRMLLKCALEKETLNLLYFAVFIIRFFFYIYCM